MYYRFYICAVKGQNLYQPKEIFKDRWEVTKKLDAGGFGQIYHPTDRVTQHCVALKVEPASNPDRAQLPIELQVMKKYQGKPHAIEPLGAGVKGDVNFIVMALIGPNLAALRRSCPIEPKRFSIGTSTKLAFDSLEAIRDLHIVNVLHRDIKPVLQLCNGTAEYVSKNTVFILDFGLARFHVDADGKIRPARARAGFRGTMRYASMASHLRQDLGRKDDLVSLFYMIYEFWKGNLPWRDQKNHADVAKAKKRVELDKMATDLHPSLSAYTSHITSLSYNDAPDYDLLLKLFTKIMEQNKITVNEPLDWNNNFAKVVEEESKTKSYLLFNCVYLSSN